MFSRIFKIWCKDIRLIGSSMPTKIWIRFLFYVNSCHSHMNIVPQYGQHLIESRAVGGNPLTPQILQSNVLCEEAVNKIEFQILWPLDPMRFVHDIVCLWTNQPTRETQINSKKWLMIVWNIINLVCGHQQQWLQEIRNSGILGV